MCPESDKDENDKAQRILKVLDDTIAKEVWSQSSFLKAIGKELSKIRDSLTDFIQSREQSSYKTVKSSKPSIQKDHLKEVFISIYSSDGSHMQSWERIIANLPKQIVSRPVYIEEIDAQNWIKHKGNKVNEGYVCMLVKEQDLLQVAEDRQPKDKFGKPLLVLKDRSVDLDNIQKFVHQSGNYHFIQGHLQKI